MNSKFDQQERINFLKNTSLFSESDEKVLKEVSNLLVELEEDKGRTIIRKGGRGKAMFIIADGSVKVHDGSHILSRMGKGQVFGEYSLFDEETRSASVTTETTTKLFKLKQEDLYKVIDSEPEITKSIIRMLVKRMRDRNVLEEKLSKSYLKIQNQHHKIESQHDNIRNQKQLLEQQNFDLLNLNEEKNHLISVIVHGLKNPLTSSMCVAELLENECSQLNEDQKEYLDLINKSLRRMSKMVNEILDVNVIDSKKYKLKKSKVNLASITREVVRNFNISIEQKKLDIDTDFKNSFAILNEVYTFQIIDNLVSNAVKYSPEQGYIKIKVFKDDNKAKFEIHDEGPGVAKNDLEKIFEKYNVNQQKYLTLKNNPDWVYPS